MLLHIPLVMACLLLTTAANADWGDGIEADDPQSSSSQSNIEGWHEDEAAEEANTWTTFFGIGYESRQAGGSSGGGGSAGASSPAAGVKRQQGRGRK